MNYKKLIPNQELRLKILGITDFIPDKMMIKIQYWIKMGKRLDLKNPTKFTEKLQWYKLYYRNPVMTKCVDKYEVREYVSSKGLEDILVPLYGVYENANDIDFSLLPDRFVLKTTNEDKSKINISEAKELLNNWLVKRTSKAGREWPYYGVIPKIICEKYLDKDENDDLIDYKFICFNGKVEYLFVNAERHSDEDMKFGIYNREFKQLPYRRKGLRNTDSNIIRPLNYEKMVEIAEVLSRDFPHVRVDLYNIKGEIYFGELTFFHGSGYIEFEPYEFDCILGEKFNLINYN